MRFVIALFAVVVTGLSFSGGSAFAAAEGKRVALLATINANPYIGAWTSTFIKAVAPAGIKVTNFTSPYDAALQSQQIDDSIAQKYDLIAVDYINDQAIIPALTRAKAAGVPVVLWATPIDKKYDDLYLSYIGTDHEDLGRFAGEELVAGLAEEGKTKAQVIAVTGLAQQLHTQTRMAAFKAVLAKHPGITLVAEEDGKWQIPPSEKITGELLVRFSGRGGVDGIFAMADNQATGAIQAVQNAGLKLGVANKGIVVVASNCMKDGVIHINSGEQYGTATQIPTDEADYAAKKIIGYFNGEKLQKNEIVKTYGITKKNVAEFAKGCSY
jgi:ABC-type sugar transport system substrate-binding protein